MRANKHWENPEVTGYGRLPPRSTFVHKDTISLNGEWRFQRFACPGDVPSSWHHPALNDSNWQTIKVPSLWTMNPELSEDRPIYTNVLMPYKTEPPFAPEINPTGIYRKNINIPKRWKSKRVVIYLGGVENCFYLYCNGKEVGFSKDCRLPTEFDITEYVHEGENQLSIQVIRFSDSSYIEDQDQWWHAGIHRDVMIYATHQVYIKDVFAKPGYTPDTGRGTLSVDVDLGDHNRSSLGFTARVTLSGLGIKPKTAERVLEKAAFYPVIGKGPKLQLELDAGKVKAWSAETPALYELSIELMDRKNKVVQQTTQRIGFRNVKIKDRELLINDQPVLIRGVNRHDHCDTSGKIMTEKLLRLDIETMKRHNINAIRTSHYPNDPLFYQLCDEYGMYVVDECNLEAHHHYAQVGIDPFWTNAFMSRLTRMVIRDKNHASIIMWSMGNETGFGPNHAAMAAWVRDYDPSRPIHNESAICEQAVADRWNENQHGTDVVCPMYPSVQEIIDHAQTSSDTRPLIMCEYAHAMGNSCGNLKEYWEAIESNHGLQGGFIWEWLDHGILQKRDNKPYWAYGGDFGEARHDLNFVCDGLCWPDRTPHSSLLEYKKIIQPIAVKKLSMTRYRVFNKDFFTDLKQYTGRWTLLRNGKPEKTGKLPTLKADPQSSQVVEINLDAKKGDPGDHLSIVFEFHLKAATTWAEMGHEVAYEQFILKAGKTAKAKVIAHGATEPEFRFDENVIRFDDTGLVSWKQGRTNILDSGPTLNIWRAPTDNDGIKGWSGQTRKALGQWQAAGLDSPQFKHHKLEISRNQIITRSTAQFATGNIEMTTRFSLLENFELQVSHQFEIAEQLPDLPRIGVRMILPRGFEDFAWFGRGPFETYVDRKSSGLVKWHHSSVKAQYVPYILPQEHGNLTDVRALSLANKKQRLSLLADNPIEASASHYPHEMLTPAFHTYELTPDPRTFLSLDVQQRGLGGASCGPDTLPQYLIDQKQYKLSYRLKVEQGA